MKMLKGIKYCGAITAVVFSLSPAMAEVNLRVDPLGALIGAANVQLDIGVSNSWTLGPTLQYLNRSIDDYDATAYGVGVRANYYFSRPVFTQGWYLGPSVSYVNAKVTEDDSLFGELEGTGSGLAFTLIGGYQWMWESFNINLGAGPVVTTIGDITVENSNGTYKEKTDGIDAGGLAIEFTLGWKF